MTFIEQNIENITLFLMSCMVLCVYNLYQVVLDYKKEIHRIKNDCIHEFALLIDSIEELKKELNIVSENNNIEAIEEKIKSINDLTSQIIEEKILENNDNIMSRIRENNSELKMEIIEQIAASKKSYRKKIQPQMKENTTSKN